MGTLHPKNAAQKARLLTASHWLCIERAKHFTDSHRETPGLSPSLRAARALEVHRNQLRRWLTHHGVESKSVDTEVDDTVTDEA